MHVYFLRNKILLSRGGGGGATHLLQVRVADGPKLWRMHLVGLLQTRLNRAGLVDPG